MLGPGLLAQRRRFVEVLEQRVRELGDKIWKNIEILEDDAVAQFNNTCPVVAIWFGNGNPASTSQLATLDSLMYAAKPIVPVATGAGSFTLQMPAQLHLINGFVLNDPKVTLDRVVNTTLEALQLLRRRRRLFISYARRDSTGVAKQLFGSLAESGFDVFLDTHSVPAAVNSKISFGTQW